MLTRSQTKLNSEKIADATVQLYDVNIDFDEASMLWNSNKKKLANCCYKYVCGLQIGDNKFCKKSSYKNKRYCFCHKHLEK